MGNNEKEVDERLTDAEERVEKLEKRVDALEDYDEAEKALEKER